MKAIGAEILEFYREWPPGDSWYLDDYENGIEEGEGENGKVLVDAGTMYDLSIFGTIFWQGEDADLPKNAPARGNDAVGFEAWFKHWKKSRTTTSVLIEVPKEKLEAFLALMKAGGFKVSKV